MSPANASTKAQKEMEEAAKAKEREFYRYYHQSQRPKTQGQSPSPVPHIPSPAVQIPQLLAVATPQPGVPEDNALTAFAQLGALRLDTRRCFISFFDRRSCYILAEATRTLSLKTGQAQIEKDTLCWGTSVFPKEQSICHYTINMPLQNDPTNPNDVPVFTVNDLSKDARFKDRAFVAGHPHARFYCGVPIRGPSGYSIGTYSVQDDRPREGLSPTEISFLKDMAITVMRHLEMTRAADDQRRGGIMVRSLGSFAEGKSNIENRWQNPWEAEAATSTAQPETISIPRQRRQTLSSAGGANAEDFEDPFIINDADSIPSEMSTMCTSPESTLPGSVAITPASEALSDGRSFPAPLKTTSSTKDDSTKGSQSPEVKATFARAANMIREATEADSTVFFDAKVSTFGGLVDDEITPDQPTELIEQDQPCVVLGASAIRYTSRTSPSGQNPMSEVILRHLLRTYPHGQIFNFDDDSAWSTQFASSGTEVDPLPTLADASTFAMSPIKRPESARSQDDENLLREVFPHARSLVLYPLWDSHRDRWFAGAIIWTSDPMRVFTSEQELSYLAAFSNSIMAEVARLDTKLADAAKGDFISSISHELRSPLHGILGSCELLQDTRIDNFQSSMAQTIETCGKTLLDTINHVLDFAKINSLTRGTSKRQKKRSQSTKHMISPAQGHANDIMTLITDVDLSVLTEEVVETVFAGYNFQKTATQVFETPSTKTDVSPISVIVDINKSDNYVFRTQPGAWRRVLMNLFGNALKYTPAGYIKLKLQVMPSNSPYDELAELRLTITDSGIGMSEEYVNNRLFHSFAQENPLSQGTGLGLSIVKQIVESLGGDIEVRSEKGRGTKFTVVCPLKHSVMSPDTSTTSPKRELLTVRKRTEGITVAFVGFDEEGDYFPLKSLKNKNATVLTVKALESLCADWFGMEVQKPNIISTISPSLFVATESGAKWMRAQSISHPNSASTAPVIVICEGAASAQSTTAITVPGQIFECISQPLGPHKLAKALTSCLDRHANRLMARVTETDTATMVPNVERLTLKENTFPVSPVGSTLDNVVDFQTPLLPPAHELHRPPISFAFSAPEIRSVDSSPLKQMRSSTPRPLHCLAVDDNPINLRLLRTFIDKLHHRHTLATNGVEAVSAFKESSIANSFDVVLMDINMPEMDGLEATRQIRAHERDLGLDPVTIIALTGVASSEAQQEAHVSGVNLFLIKPVRLGELETVLKGVVIGDNKKGKEEFKLESKHKRAESSTK